MKRKLSLTLLALLYIIFSYKHLSFPIYLSISSYLFSFHFSGVDPKFDAIKTDFISLIFFFMAVLEPILIWLISDLKSFFF